MQMPLTPTLSPLREAREKSGKAPRPACGEREGPAKREGEGQTSLCMTSALPGSH